MKFALSEDNKTVIIELNSVGVKKCISFTTVDETTQFLRELNTQISGLIGNLIKVLQDDLHTDLMSKELTVERIMSLPWTRISYKTHKDCKTFMEKSGVSFSCYNVETEQLAIQTAFDQHISFEEQYEKLLPWIECIKPQPKTGLSIISIFDFELSQYTSRRIEFNKEKFFLIEGRYKALEFSSLWQVLKYVYNNFPYQVSEEKTQEKNTSTKEEF